MVPDEAKAWVEIYRNVLNTGNPVRFEPELVATKRHLGLAAFRIEPIDCNLVGVLRTDLRSEDSQDQPQVHPRALNFITYHSNSKAGHSVWEKSTEAAVVGKKCSQTEQITPRH